MPSQADDQATLMEAILTMREAHDWTDAEIAEIVKEVQSVLE